MPVGELCWRHNDPCICSYVSTVITEILDALELLSRLMASVALRNRLCFRETAWKSLKEHLRVRRLVNDPPRRDYGDVPPRNMWPYALQEALWDIVLQVPLQDSGDSRLSLAVKQPWTSFIVTLPTAEAGLIWLIRSIFNWTNCLSNFIECGQKIRDALSHITLMSHRTT